MTKCGASASRHKEIVKSKIVQQNETRKEEAPVKSWTADSCLSVSQQIFSLGSNGTQWKISKSVFLFLKKFDKNRRPRIQYYPLKSCDFNHQCCSLLTFLIFFVTLHFIISTKCQWKFHNSYTYRVLWYVLTLMISNL